MTISKSVKDNVGTLSLIGRLDTVTSNQLSDELENIFKEDLIKLVLDFAGIEYISSAGLRVLIVAQKKTASLDRKMEIVNASDSVKEIFRITGFSNILTVI